MTNKQNNYIHKIFRAISILDETGNFLTPMDVKRYAKSEFLLESIKDLQQKEYTTMVEWCIRVCSENLSIDIIKLANEVNILGGDGDYIKELRAKP